MTAEEFAWVQMFVKFDLYATRSMVTDQPLRGVPYCTAKIVEQWQLLARRDYNYHKRPGTSFYRWLAGRWERPDVAEAIEALCVAAALEKMR